MAQNTTPPEQQTHLPTLQILKLLADDTRWKLISELRLSDRQVGELVTRLQLPQNLVSYHLNLLRQAGLAQMRRSDADARALYYGLDLSTLLAYYAQIGISLQLPNGDTRTDPPPISVVFLCTANSARSQMAEGWLRHVSAGHVSVSSAGTQPQRVHPLAIEVMAEVGIDMTAQHSKGIAALTNLTPDAVVTVCDRAREECVPCLNAPTQLHWSIPDPVRAQGSHDEQMAAFRAVRDQLQRRVSDLVTLLPALQMQ